VSARFWVRARLGERGERSSPSWTFIVSFFRLIEGQWLAIMVAGFATFAAFPEIKIGPVSR
jgi:hypothetical protein